MIWDKNALNRRAIIPLDARGVGQIIAINNLLYVGCKSAYIARRSLNGSGLMDEGETNSKSKLYVINARQYMITEVGVVIGALQYMITVVGVVIGVLQYMITEVSVVIGVLQYMITEVDVVIGVLQYMIIEVDVVIGVLQYMITKVKGGGVIYNRGVDFYW